MPSAAASGYISVVEPNSSIEHIIPKESTPRSFPFLIFIPFSAAPSLCVAATRPPSNTTGTLSPSLTFGAPVTICTSFPSSSICTWQITSLSASGCFSILLIFPTMILSKFLSNSVNPSTFVPESVIASVYSCAVQSRSGTYALIHDNDVSIISSVLKCVPFCFLFSIRLTLIRSAYCIFTDPVLNYFVNRFSKRNHFPIHLYCLFCLY